MDVWVVAAAAGAGYVAQQLKNLNRGKRISCDLSSENGNLVGPDCSGVTLKSQETSGQEHYWQREQAYCDASTSGSNGEHPIMLDDFVSRDGDSASYSLVELLNGEDIQGDWEDRMPADAEVVITGDSIPQPSSRGSGIHYELGRNKSNLRRRGIRSRIMKPRTSLESCLMAQLFKEHSEFEEYVGSVHSPQKASLRLISVTDGNRIVSRAPNSKSSEIVKHEECNTANLVEKNSVVGLPRLPNAVHKRADAKCGPEQVSAGRNNAKFVNGNRNNEQGLSHNALQFFLGLMVGIIYSSLGSKWEIEKLCKSLAQTEHLVQDLQEELNMNDALTVKELAVEDHESMDMQNDSCIDDSGQSLSLDAKQDDFSRNCDQKCGAHDADEESLRKIEAELEAELDMLESNMKSSRFEGQLSNLSKLDPNFVSDVINDELRPDSFGLKVVTQACADWGGSVRSTPRYAQYPVSPRELSLRLHEVIQSRLEQRVKELEMELQHSRKKLECLESYHKHSPTDCTTAGRTPVLQDDEPVIISLSSSGAYNDVYEEETSHHEFEVLHKCRHDPDLVRNGGLNNHTEQNLTPDGSQETVIKLLNDGLFSSRDDESDEDDEMEKLLIRQIVEKMRQGSPAVLKAQRGLLSTGLN